MRWTYDGIKSFCVIIQALGDDKQTTNHEWKPRMYGGNAYSIYRRCICVTLGRSESFDTLSRQDCMHIGRLVCCAASDSFLPAPLAAKFFFLVPNDAIYVPASHRLIQMRGAESKSAITHRLAKVNRRQFKLLAHAVSRLRFLSFRPETSIGPQKSICVAAIMFSNLFDSVVWMQRDFGHADSLFVCCAPCDVNDPEWDLLRSLWKHIPSHVKSTPVDFSASIHLNVVSP